MSQKIRTTIYLDDLEKNLLEIMQNETDLNRSELIRESLIKYYDSDNYFKKKKEKTEKENIENKLKNR